MVTVHYVLILMGRYTAFASHMIVNSTIRLRYVILVVIQDSLYMDPVVYCNLRGVCGFKKKDAATNKSIFII